MNEAATLEQVERIMNALRTDSGVMDSLERMLKQIPAEVQAEYASAVRLPEKANELVMAAYSRKLALAQLVLLDNIQKQLAVLIGLHVRVTRVE